MSLLDCTQSRRIASIYISNNPVFSDLIGSDVPSLSYTVYDPVDNWGRPELIALRRGSILIQIADSGAGCWDEQSYKGITLTTGGGPYYATYTLPFFVREQAFDLLAFGVAGAGR